MRCITLMDHLTWTKKSRRVHHWVSGISTGMREDGAAPPAPSPAGLHSSASSSRSSLHSAAMESQSESLQLLLQSSEVVPLLLRPAATATATISCLLLLLSPPLHAFTPLLGLTPALSASVLLVSAAAAAALLLLLLLSAFSLPFSLSEPLSLLGSLLVEPLPLSPMSLVVLFFSLGSSGSWGNSGHLCFLLKSLETNSGVAPAAEYAMQPNSI